MYYTDEAGFEKSTVLDKAYYDKVNENLMVLFKAGYGYVYYDVPPYVFDGLVNDISAGSYYSRNIRGKYRDAIFNSWYGLELRPTSGLTYAEDAKVNEASEPIESTNDFVSVVGDDGSFSLGSNGLLRVTGQVTSVPDTNTKFYLTAPVEEEAEEEEEFDFEVTFEVNESFHTTTVKATTVQNAVGQVREYAEMLNLEFKVCSVTVNFD